VAGTHPSIPILDLGGTSGQIGAAHGESQRDRIRAYADRFLGASPQLADALTHPVMPSRAGGAHFLISGRQHHLSGVRS
jgi:hypothetical protein